MSYECITARARETVELATTETVEISVEDLRVLAEISSEGHSDYCDDCYKQTESYIARRLKEQEEKASLVEEIT